MKQHTYRGKRVKLKDRGPLCEALFNARMRLAGLDHEINWISELNKKDYWSHDEVREVTEFIEKHGNKQRKN